MAKPEIRQRVVHTDVRLPRELPRSVSVTVFDNKEIVENKRHESMAADALPTLTLLGYGHRNTINRKTVDWLGRDQDHYAVGVVLPFNALPANKNVIDAGCRQMPHAVADFLRDEAQLPHDQPIQSIGYSQGGGVWGLARKERTEGLGDVALVTPVGICSDEYIAQTDARALRREFLRRFKANLSSQSFGELETYLSGFEIGGQFVFDSLTRRLDQKLNCALTQSIQDGIVKHVESGKHVALILGEKDGVFPLDEVTAALSEHAGYVDYKPELTIVEGVSHVAPTTIKGKQLLREGVRSLNRFAQAPQ